MPNRSETNRRTPLQYQLASSMPACSGNSGTAAFNSAGCLSTKGGGEPPVCSNIKAGRPSLAEGGQPTADGVGIPFQRLRRGRGGPALCQQQHGVPPPELAGGPVPWALAQESSGGARHWHPSAIVPETGPSPITSITNPSQLPRPANPVPSQIYPMPLRISPRLWFRPPRAWVSDGPSFPNARLRRSTGNTVGSYRDSHVWATL